MKKIKIPLPIYRMTIYVWLGKPEEADKEFQKTWYVREGKNEIILMHGGTKTLSSKGIDPIIWIDSGTNKIDIISGLSHELLHAITYQLFDRGLYFDSENHESYAYILGYCMQEALKKLNL